MQILLPLLNLRLKQTIRGEGFRGLLKFLAPDFLVGFFLALTAEGFQDGSFPGRVAIVSFGVALFTLVAETRRLFFNGGDVEGFYFVQPGYIFRMSSAMAIVLLGIMVSMSIFLPVIVFSGIGIVVFQKLAIAFAASSCASVSTYLIILFLMSALSDKFANVALTVTQLIMALVLLALFQLSAGFRMGFGSAGSALSQGLILAVLLFLYGLYPFAERLSSRFSWNYAASRFDLVRIAGKVKDFLLIRSGEEEAGFMLFVSNLMRSSSFRLSAIGIAAMPVMVAVYWSMQGVHFMMFDVVEGFFSSNLVAPFVSLVVSAVLVHYFLSQNVLSSVDYEASWLVRTSGEFDCGRFVLGVRKAMLVTIHVPMTLVVFFVLIFGNSLLVAALCAVTFYLLSHVAASWFSVMQRKLPFSLPYTRIGAIETVNLSFMLIYSMLVSVALFVSFGRPEKLLAVNLTAFILVGVLEQFSIKMVNRRVRPGV